MTEMEKLTQKGQKHNLQFPAALKERFITECGFTDEEIEILNLRSRGKSIVEIAMLMSNDYYYDTRKVERRIRSIKDKIAAQLSRP